MRAATIRRTWWIPLVAGGLLAAVYVASGIVGPMEWAYRSELRRSRQFIAAVEGYRAKHGRLPDEAEAEAMLDDMPWHREGACPCYRRESPQEYLVWFQGRSLGDSFTYDSQTGVWSEGG
jgi:hypothetical protein